MHVKAVEVFPQETYQLSPEEQVVNAFTVSCEDPDMTGFNYYGLYAHTHAHNTKTRTLSR